MLEVPDIFSLIQASVYFQDLPAPQQRVLAESSHMTYYSAQELIFWEGDPVCSLFMIVSGKVKVYKQSSEGKEIILHLFSSGESFAEFPFFMQLPHYPACAMALQDTRLLVVDGYTFGGIALNSAEVLRKIVARLAQRLNTFNSLIEDLSHRSVESRLAKYLVSQGRATSRLQIHKKTLAAILGTIPETLSRAFARLTRDGLIVMDGLDIQILDYKALLGLADIDGRHEEELSLLT